MDGWTEMDDGNAMEAVMAMEMAMAMSNGVSGCLLLC